MGFGIELEGVVLNVSERPESSIGLDRLDDVVLKLLDGRGCQVDVVNNMVFDVSVWERLDDPDGDDRLGVWLVG